MSDKTKNGSIVRNKEYALEDESPKRKSIFRGEKHAPVDESPKRNPHRWTNRYYVSLNNVSKHYNPWSLNPDDMDLEATAITPEKAMFKPKEKSVFAKTPYTMVIVHRGNLYGIVKGVNSAHIDEIDNEGHLIKPIGNVIYDPRSNSLIGIKTNGGAMPSEIVPYLGEILYDIPRNPPEITIDPNASIYNMIHKLNELWQS